MKNFTIGSEIVTLLNTNGAVHTAVRDKIFPLVASASTTFPFIVYRRSYYKPASNKDYENEKVGIEIIVASNKYSDSVTIANSVADALNHQSTAVIEDINVTNTNEDYLEDTYIQRLFLEVEIK